MKRSVLTLLLFFPVVLFAQLTSYAVKGKMARVNGVQKAFLIYSYGVTTVIDSSLVIDGNFSFTGTVTSTRKASLYITHNGEVYGTFKYNIHADATDIYLEEGTIQVTGTDSVKNATISGSITNNESHEIAALLKPGQENLKQLFADEKNSGIYPEQSAADKRTTDLNAEFEKRYYTIQAEQKNIRYNFMKAHPMSWINIELLLAYGGNYPEYNEVNPVFETFSPGLKSSPSGKYYASVLDKIKLLALGAQAPAFTQNDTSGNPVSLNSFRGKYVLVDFWASWCGPCRAENPNLVKAYMLFKDKGFTVLGVSLDQPTGHDRWLKAIADDGLGWTQVSDLKFWQNEVALLYNINSIPQNFLLDPDGKIIAKNLRGGALTDKLSQLIDKKATVTSPSNK